jgi:molecular chaperone GrpE
LNNWKRERADFLNYKKDEQSRAEGMNIWMKGQSAYAIFPLLDNLEIAEKNLSEELKNDESIKGILQIKSQIIQFFKNLDVEAIDSKGKKFDPEFHEAIEEVSDTENAPGTVIEELQKGYTLKGHVLRPAKVKISK